MGAFSPAYQGTLQFQSLPADFTERIARRVQDGLLVPGSRRRANYVVSSKSPDAIEFKAADLLTAYNVGLNNVLVERKGPNAVVYQGRFWRWTAIACGQALVIAAAILLVIVTMPGARAQVDAYSWGWAYLGALLTFFGLAFPWLLVAVHRRFAARALERIVREAVTA